MKSWLCALALCVPLVAAAEPVRLGLVIGVNRSLDPAQKQLRYADDDAAQYRNLFQLVGIRTWLLARLDDNTKRLHPGAASEALAPIGAALDAAVTEMASAITSAQAAGDPVTVYVVYAGHGDVRDGDGYLALEDTRLSAAALRNRIFARLPAERIHFIVDACYASFLATARGPGGARRSVTSFSDAAALLENGKVGLILSTGSARESHEWEGFEAGVFSHEVRSALYGGADADGDGQITYRELAAFVDRANAAIPNERFRPDIHARPPRDSDVLLDLRASLVRRVEIAGTMAGRYRAEDGRGVRLFDVHGSGERTLSLLRPSSGALYLHRFSDEREFQVPAEPPVVRLVELSSAPAHVARRGAAHDAFMQAFALPFDSAVVARYRERDVSLALPPPRRWRRSLTFGLLGLGLALGAGGGTLTGVAVSASHVASGASQADAQAANQRVRATNVAAISLYAIGGAALATSLGLALWTLRTGRTTIAALPSLAGVALTATGTF